MRLMKVKTWTASSGRVWFQWQIKDRIAKWTDILLRCDHSDYSAKHCRQWIATWSARLEELQR
jgi:hypothetical protein